MSDFYYEQRKLELMHPSNLDENPYRGHSEKTEKSPEPKKKITQEYLTDSGFTPFCEDDAIKEIAKHMPDNFGRSDIFSSFGKWRIWRLNIEDLYAKAGWEVYNEYHVYRAGKRFDSRICYRFRKSSPTALNS